MGFKNDKITFRYFQIDYEKIKKLEGWGDLSISNLNKAILKSKYFLLDKFIFSIGIRHIGQENAKIIAGYFGTIKEFTNLFDLKLRKKSTIEFTRFRWNR